MAKYEIVEQYVDALDGTARDALETVRALVHEVLPDVGETIAYDMPTFTRDGRHVLHLAAWAKHLSIYGEPDAPPDDPGLSADLAPHSSGKGTLRFELRDPLPLDLLRRTISALGVRAG